MVSEWPTHPRRDHAISADHQRATDEHGTLCGQGNESHGECHDDGRWVASAGEDSAVKIWDSRTGKLVRNFRGHTSVVTSVAFSPDGQWLVSGSRDHTVKVWDLAELDEVARRQRVQPTEKVPSSQGSDR